MIAVTCVFCSTSQLLSRSWRRERQGFLTFWTNCLFQWFVKCSIFSAERGGVIDSYYWSMTTSIAYVHTGGHAQQLKGTSIYTMIQPSYLFVFCRGLHTFQWLYLWMYRMNQLATASSGQCKLWWKSWYPGRICWVNVWRWSDSTKWLWLGKPRQNRDRWTERREQHYAQQQFVIGCYALFICKCRIGSCGTGRTTGSVSWCQRWKLMRRWPQYTCVIWVKEVDSVAPGSIMRMKTRFSSRKSVIAKNSTSSVVGTMTSIVAVIGINGRMAMVLRQVRRACQKWHLVQLKDLNHIL